MCEEFGPSTNSSVLLHHTAMQFKHNEIVNSKILIAVAGRFEFQSNSHTYHKLPKWLFCALGSSTVCLKFTIEDESNQQQIC